MQSSELLADDGIAAAFGSLGQLNQLGYRNRGTARFRSRLGRATHGLGARLLALMAEQGDGGCPPAVDLADNPILGDASLVDKDLVELAYAGHLHEPTHVDTRLLHRENEHGDATVFRSVPVGACEKNGVLALLGTRGPDFLSADNPFVAVEDGLGRKRREVGTRPGFGVHLAPEVIAPQTRG